MRVYEAMLEKEGEQYVLPVSVSPEYRGSAMDAWGRNASFQIGCIHWLVEALEHTAQVLGEASDPQWAAIRKGLPRACVEGAAGREMIMLWEGTPLEESHRHHSHWAGLYPWDVIDLEDPAWKRIVGRTYDWWNRQGMGQWSGWCVPWAAMLHARVGSPELAEALLEYWERIYTNEGHGTLHDANVFKRNVQTMAKRPPEVPYTGGGARGEVMQIEAGMAAAAAVLDGLVQVRRGVHYLFAGAPGWWRRASFKGIRTEGGFLVSGQLRDGQVPEVQVRATRAGVFRMRWTGGETVRCGDKEVAVVDGVVSVEMGQGEVVRLSSSKGAS
jgi:hypothetical protein